MKEEILGNHHISFSIGSVQGVRGISSIRLIETVNGKEVSFLVETGATHNFIDPLTVNMLKLPAEEVKKFKIRVAGGEKFEGINCCRNTKISIQGVETNTELLVAPWVIHR